MNRTAINIGGFQGAVRLIALSACVFSCVAGLPSCKSSKKEEEDAAAKKDKETPTSKVEDKAPWKEEGVDPLGNWQLKQISGLSALVRLEGQIDKPGLIVGGTVRKSSGSRYFIFCEASENTERGTVLYSTRTGIGRANLKRVSNDSSGLALFSFSTKDSPKTYQIDDAGDDQEVHALRISEDGSIPDAELESVEMEIDEIQNKISELDIKREELAQENMQARRPSRLDRDPRMGSMDSRREDMMAARELQEEFRREMMRLDSEINQMHSRISGLSAKSKFPASGIKIEEIASAKSAASLEKANIDLENSILVTKSGQLRSIRFQGKWLSADEIVNSGEGGIESAKITVSGRNNGISLTCHIVPDLPFVKDSYSMIAATTFELESQGSGSVEERLATLTPAALRIYSDSLGISSQLKWNGKKSKLWIRVFNDKTPNEPVLDELIEIDYQGQFFAKWEKPPSPLIEIPEPQANQPQDLVSEKQTLDAKGEIVDLITAGDGSVVIVRTNKAPYCTPFDLKSGKWLPAKWKATENTLVAAQAGKVYLLDRETMVLEVWNLASGERTGLHVLQLDEKVIAFAAPLTNPDMPLILATEKGCFCLDPVEFERISSGLGLEKFYEPDSRYGDSNLINPDTVNLRITDDGAIYSFSGLPASEQTSRRKRQSMILDNSGIVVRTLSSSDIFASRGRVSSDKYPDHGGSGMSVSPRSVGRPFPEPNAKITFYEPNGRSSFAELYGAPTLPVNAGQGTGFLAEDRGCYFDSQAKALLLPDGNVLHFFKLRIPEGQKPLPETLLVGETIEIPLPPGDRHVVTASLGGTSVIEGDVAKWTATDEVGDKQVNLTLTWRGELGSEMKLDHSVKVFSQIGMAEAISTDGKKRIPLKARGVIIGERGSNIVGFAGSGAVVICRDREKLIAWNTLTCQKIFEKENVPGNFVFGDADHIYVAEDKKRITSFDAGTGEILAEKPMSSDLRDITTGMSSRSSLLAIERQDGRVFVLEFDRETLIPTILNFEADLTNRLTASDLTSNASGSAIWSRETMFYRDGKTVTLKTVGRTNNSIRLVDAVPDESGQYLLKDEWFLDISQNPPIESEVSGAGHSVNGGKSAMDKSGKYILVWNHAGDAPNQEISIRNASEPNKEILKVKVDSAITHNPLYFVSSTGTFISPVSSNRDLGYLVYDLDIPKLLKDLSR
ncbi:MAG: hypothetical protein ACSHX9_04370 [Luteolibacter sp.]